MKKIENVYKALEQLSYLNQNADGGIDKDELTGPVNMLRNFLLAQEAEGKASGKVDIKKYLSNDKLHEVMQNVAYFTKRREAVASDMHSLIVSKPDYFDPMPGAVLNREGEDDEFFQIDETSGWVSGRKYPDYRSVFPRKTEVADIEPREVIAERMRRAKSAMKYTKTKKDFLWFKLGIWWFKFDQIEKMLALPGWGLMQQVDVKCGGPERRPAVYEDENYKALFMPCILPATSVEFEGIEGVAV